MKTRICGASLLSVLMLTAAACGRDNNAYDTADNDDDRDDVAAYDDDRNEADRNDADNQYARTQDGYDESDEGMGSAAQTAPGAAVDPDPDVSAAMADTRVADSDMTRSRAEIQALASRAFSAADINDDGAIDREEYVKLALASARDLDSFVTDPQIDAAAMRDQGAVSPAPGEDTGDTVAPTDETAGAEPTRLATTDSAEIEITAAQSFDEVAGPDDEMTQEELRTAFLSRFEEADADGDDQLDAEELQTFAALTRGEAENN